MAGNAGSLQPPISAERPSLTRTANPIGPITVEIKKRRIPVSEPSEDQLESTVGELVLQAHKLVNEYLPPSKLPDSLKYEILSLGLRLFRLIRSETRHESDVETQFLVHHISKTKRTDVFTRLVKLLFKNEPKRTDVNRLANTLRLAVARKITSNEMPIFIKRNGGVVACSQLYKTEYGKARVQTKRLLIDLLQEAAEVDLDLPCALDKPFSVVFIPKANGKLSFLSWRPVPESELENVATELIRRKGKAGWLKPGCSVPAREKLRLRSRP